VIDFAEKKVPLKIHILRGFLMKNEYTIKFRTLEKTPFRRESGYMIGAMYIAAIRVFELSRIIRFRRR